jgi:hypothetical protein
MVDDYLRLFEQVRRGRGPRDVGANQAIGSPGMFSHGGPHRPR